MSEMVYMIEKSNKLKKTLIEISLSDRDIKKTRDQPSCITNIHSKLPQYFKSFCATSYNKTKTFANEAYYDE